MYSKGDTPQEFSFLINEQINVCEILHLGIVKEECSSKSLLSTSADECLRSRIGETEMGAAA